MGKSQMLQAVAAVAPRGVYVCGNTTTSAGLTVSIHRDAVTGDYTLEAGTISPTATGEQVVHANQSIVQLWNTLSR